MARFKEKPRECRACGHGWRDHEEKETDVRIAVQLLHDLYEGEFDAALLISADSDLVPAVEMVFNVAPKTPVHLLVPPGRWGRCRELEAVASTKRLIKKSHLVKNLLPEKLHIEKRIIRRPRKYDPPR